MITDKLLDILFGFVNNILDSLPDMAMSIDYAVLEGFLDVVGAALYFFPWQKVVPILGIIVIMQSWRILISIIKTIWAVLPFV